MNTWYLFFILATVTVIAASFNNKYDINADLNNRELEDVNGTIYYFSEPGWTYNIGVAMTRCNDMGMKLVSVTSQEKLINLAYYVDNNRPDMDGYWTSGMRVYADMFIWSGTGQEFTYTNWSPGQPNDSPDLADCCVLANKDHTWVDAGCGFYYPIICEF